MNIKELAESELEKGTKHWSDNTPKLAQAVLLLLEDGERLANALDYLMASEGIHGYTEGSDALAQHKQTVGEL